MINDTIKLSDQQLTMLLAMLAPEPDEETIKMDSQRDRNLNPHGDYHKPQQRSRTEIICDRKLEFVQTMYKRYAMKE